MYDMSTGIYLPPLRSVWDYIRRCNGITFACGKWVKAICKCLLQQIL